MKYSILLFIASIIAGYIYDNICNNIIIALIAIALLLASGSIVIYKALTNELHE